MASVAYRGMVKAVRKKIKTKAQFLNDADSFQSMGRFETGEYQQITALINETFPDAEETEETETTEA